ncbi:MAG: HEAT repeat domain-containing protein, partial [Ktedonobacterales bacterium]
MTTALYALAAARTRRRTTVALCLGRRLPVFVSLASVAIASPGDDGEMPATLAAIVARAAAPFATAGLALALPRLARNGRLLLICDELDALPAQSRVTFCDALAAFGKSGGKFIVACRRETLLASPATLRSLGDIPRVRLDGLDPGTVTGALRRARPPRAERAAADWIRETPHVLRAHQLENAATLPAQAAALLRLARAGDALPFGRAKLSAASLDALCRPAGVDGQLSRLLGVLAASLLDSSQPAIALDAQQSLGGAIARALAESPPIIRTDPGLDMLDASLLDALARRALDAGLLMITPDGGALTFTHSLLRAQCAAAWLAAGDDGTHWLAPELLGAGWTLAVVLWGGLRDEPVDVARRLLRLADTPDTTALRAGLALRDDVPAAIFALAIATLAEALAAQLASAAGTDGEGDLTARAERQLRDLLDRTQVYLADGTNVPRLAAALRAVAARSGIETTLALAFLIEYPPLSRLLRGQLVTLLGLLATPLALEVVVNQLGASDPLLFQAVAQALEWAGRAAIAALEPAVTSPDERIRRRAGEALARYDAAAATAAVTSLRAPSPTQRLTAARALAATTSATNAEPAVEALALALDDADGEVRRTAVVALGQIGTPVAIHNLMRLLSSRDADLRQSVASALGASASTVALPALIHLLDDDDALVRAAAVASLAEMDDERATAAIASRRDDPDRWVRHAVAQALRR